MTSHRQTWLSWLALLAIVLVQLGIAAGASWWLDRDPAPVLKAAAPPAQIDAPLSPTAPAPIRR